MNDDDQVKRTKFSETIEAKLDAASNNEIIDHDAVRANDPALADVLDEFLLSKSYRTDPKTTAKQVAEVLIAQDPASKIGQLIGSLNDELNRKDEK